MVAAEFSDACIPLSGLHQDSSVVGARLQPGIFIWLFIVLLSLKASASGPASALSMTRCRISGKVYVFLEFKSLLASLWQARGPT